MNSIVHHQTMTMEGRYQSYKRKKSNQNTPAKDDYKDNVNLNDSRSDYNRTSTIGAMTKTEMSEALNLKFCAKIFKPDSPFFLRLAQIWGLEADLEEVLSLIVPEANRTKNPLLIEYSERISSISS